jgi:hypothetical protein
VYVNGPVVQVLKKITTSDFVLFFVDGPRTVNTLFSCKPRVGNGSTVHYIPEAGDDVVQRPVDVRTSHGTVGGLAAREQRGLDVA